MLILNCLVPLFFFFFNQEKYKKGQGKVFQILVRNVLLRSMLFARAVLRFSPVIILCSSHLQPVRPGGEELN